MARRVFFSFHFDGDIWRANQVRNCNVVHGCDRAGFYDHSEYIEAKRRGDDGIRRMIIRHLEGTSVTVVLIGERTASRRWVKYEVAQSIARGNGLLGIYVDHLKDQYGRASWGILEPDAPSVPWSVDFPCYRWDGNVDRFRRAIEEAGQRADRIRGANRVAR